MPPRHEEPPPPPPPLVVPPVEPASNELVNAEDDEWPYGTSEVITDGPLAKANVPGCCGPPMAVTNPCRICDSIPPAVTLFCCCCCVCSVIVCCCTLPPPLLLGTAVAFSNCSLSLPPHSLIRCNSASSNATSFSRVCMRASFVSKMAVRVVLPGTPPGTATLPPRTVPPAPDTLPSPTPALPPATAAPDDAVDAYASSSCVCRLFRLSFVALSSFTTQAIETRLHSSMFPHLVSL